MEGTDVFYHRTRTVKDVALPSGHVDVNENRLTIHSEGRKESTDATHHHVLAHSTVQGNKWCGVVRHQFVERHAFLRDIHVHNAVLVAECALNGLPFRVVQRVLSQDRVSCAEWFKGDDAFAVPASAQIGSEAARACAYVQNESDTARFHEGYEAIVIER